MKLISSGLLLLISVIANFCIFQVDCHGSGAKIPALMVFGDSIVDSGNNNDLPTSAKCNFPPYGVNFTNHKPTGRFSNGKIPTDLLASKLGIKEYVPPYVGTELSSEDLMTGVCFASGGAGFDPITSKAVLAISMEQQLDLFKEYKEKVIATAGPERAATIISDSLYLICAGSDDVLNTYFPTLYRKTMYDMPSYANLLVRLASDFMQQLLQVGARRIGIVSLPPIGCAPSQRTVGGGIKRECASPQNQMAQMFNARLNAEVSNIQNQRPESQMLFLDFYGKFNDMVLHPQNYGFEVTSEGCCGTGTLEAAILCNSITCSICDDVSKYLFWDAYHPTEKAYNILADYIVQKYIPLLT